jgi:hypothetical protein
MVTTPRRREDNEIKNIWQAICARMNERRMAPKQVAYKTGYPLKYIERGIVGEPAPITLDFLQDFVTVLGLTSGRTKHYEDTAEILSWEDCVALIKPQPAMPPRQGNFWEWSD